MLAPSRTDDQSANIMFSQLMLPPHESLEHWYYKGKSLPRSSNRFYNYIFVLHEERYRRSLHWSHSSVSHGRHCVKSEANINFQTTLEYSSAYIQGVSSVGRDVHGPANAVDMVGGSTEELFFSGSQFGIIQ